MLTTRLLDALPSLCAVCRGWGGQAVCETCVDRYATPEPRCTRCALQVPEGVAVCGECLLVPPAFDVAVTGVHYGHPWSGLITRFKFHGSLELAHVLADPLHDALRRSARPRPELLLPVPLSRERLRERGYNQAWEIARRLGRRLNVPTDAHTLLRLQDRPHQLDLPPEERAANVRGVFAVEPLRRHELAGRRIAVVDDVMTTGATLGEIARVLKQAGAATVEAWALARTPRPAG
jgi:ComF family protein